MLFQDCKPALYNPKLADQTFWIMLIASVPFYFAVYLWRDSRKYVVKP